MTFVLAVTDFILLNCKGSNLKDKIHENPNNFSNTPPGLTEVGQDRKKYITEMGEEDLKIWASKNLETTSDYDRVQQKYKNVSHAHDRKNFDGVPGIFEAMNNFASGETIVCEFFQ